MSNDTWARGLVADFTETNLSFSAVGSVDSFTTGFFCLLGLRKHFGRLHRYFAHVVSSISLTFCYLLKQSGLFSFKRSVKWRGVRQHRLTWYQKTNFRLFGSKDTFNVKGSLASLPLIPTIWRGLLEEFFLPSPKQIIYLKLFTTSKNTAL